MKEIVVSAGGTREKIDDVRYVGNFSSGRLGRQIAEVAARSSDVHVTLIAPQSTVDRFGLSKNITHEPFVTSRDLREKLLGIKTADVVFHSAAVADYIPDSTPGKIPSYGEELVVTMKRNPKILSEMRGHFGEETILAGFKLLSGVDQHRLQLDAYKQIEDNGLDFCIANDFQKITDDYREVTVLEKTKGVTWAGEPRRFMFDWYEGATDEVAEKIYNRIANRKTDYDLAGEDWREHIIELLQAKYDYD